MKKLRDGWRVWWDYHFGSRQLHAVAAVGLAAMVTAAGGWYVDGCNEQPFDASDDPGIADPACADSVCAAAAKRCKGRYTPLKNYRHEVIVVPSTFKTYTIPIYTVGSRHAWCWYSGGRIYWRSSQLKSDPTGPAGGVDLDTDWWQPSICYDGNRHCLYRVESRATVGFDWTIPVIGVTIHPSFTQHRCIATRISSGGGHHRVIHLGACPPPSGARVARASGSATSAGDEARVGTLTFNGVRLKSVDPSLVRKLMRAIVSRENLAHMKAHDGQPSPRVKSLTQRAYFSLSPAERKKLRAVALQGPEGNPAGNARSN